MRPTVGPGDGRLTLGGKQSFTDRRKRAWIVHGSRSYPVVKEPHLLHRLDRYIHAASRCVWIGQKFDPGRLVKIAKVRRQLFGTPPTVGDRIYAAPILGVDIYYLAFREI